MKAPAMRRQKTRVIRGSKMKLILRRITRAANFIGWKYVVTCDDHLICRGFTNTLELDRAFDRAEEKAIAAIESNAQDLRFEAIYDKWSKMPEHGRHAVACYMLGLMSKSMIDFHLNKFDEQVNEFLKIHIEMQALEVLKKEERPQGPCHVKCKHCCKFFYYKRDAIAHVMSEHLPFNRQHEIIDAAEELLPDCPLDCDELDENKQCQLTKCKFNAVELFDDSKFENNNVDVSDCCQCEDIQTVQPPLRSSVQSSPDDPYYVCGSCEQKCELETITRKELDNG